MPAELIIRNALVVTSEGTRPLDVLVRDGLIVGLMTPGLASIGASQVIDADGLIALPGAIDGHTHYYFQDPQAGYVDEASIEGFENGGSTAAAGGITTAVEMPQAIPTTADGATFQRKIELATTESIGDFALYGGIVGGQTLDTVQEQVDRGAAGFKSFLINDDPAYPPVSDAELFSALEFLKDSGLMLSVHAESQSLAEAFYRQVLASGRGDPLAYAETRPPLVEAEAVNRVIFFAEQTGGWAHIAHMSSPAGAELVRRAKQRGVRITAETCPQYLALSLDDLARLGPYAKCAPPVRSRAEVEQMWDYLADGTIDCITSDHCPWSFVAKEAGRDDILKAPNGLPGLQTLLPLVIDEGRKRGFTWEQIARWTAETPARLWNLAPRKGSLQVGADADIVLIDPQREWVLKNEDLLQTFRWSPFAGRSFTVRVLRTILRGVTIFDDAVPERITVQPGFGRFIPASPFKSQPAVTCSQRSGTD